MRFGKGYQIDSEIIHIPTSSDTEYTYTDIDDANLSYEMDDPFQYSDLKVEISEFLSILTAREKVVIQLYYGLDCEYPHTYEEIGELFDLTKPRIQFIRNKAIKKIRKYLG